jgi:hypothetical protein
MPLRYWTLFSAGRKKTRSPRISEGRFSFAPLTVNLADQLLPLGLGLGLGLDVAVCVPAASLCGCLNLIFMSVRSYLRISSNI